MTMTLDTEYLTTTQGRLKCLNIGIGLLGVALTSAGHDKQGLTGVPSVHCSHNNGPCVHVWAAELGMSIVILAWLFSIAMLVGSLLARFKKRAWVFRKVDIWGHWAFGMALILASMVMLVYIITGLQNACSAIHFSREDCAKMVFTAGFAVTSIWTSIVLSKTQ